VTAGTATATRRPAASEWRRNVRLRPAEGWLTLFAAILMVIAFAGSIVDAGWIPGAQGNTGYLLYLGILGVLFGFLGAKVGWGRWRTILVGALLGGLVLPLIAGGQMLGPSVGIDPHGLAERMAVMAAAGRHVWDDLAIRGLPYTNQYAHYHLVFGTLVWGAGMLAGFTVFGHRRPLDAVVVVGLAILASMIMTKHDQLTLLVIFSLGALLLLIRTHVFEEEVTWARRKIGDPSSVGQLYLRGGAAFVTAAVVGSILLTTAASSAPLQGLWQDLPQKLQWLTTELQKFAPPGGDYRGAGVISFSEHVVTSGLWEPSSETAFRAQITPSSDLREFKWRAGTYAVYDNFGWSWGQTRDIPTAGRDVLLNNPNDGPTDIGRRVLTYRVIPVGFRDATILGPNTLQRVDRATNAVVTGTDGWFTTVESTESLSTYNASAMVRVFVDVPGGITQSRLRAAGTQYPPEVVSMYGAPAVPAGALGPAATQLLDDIRAQVRTPASADPRNPYDLARTMEEYLRDPDHFKYQRDVRTERNAQCDGVSTVECFARIKAGYCEYYASTMAILLRASGVPARIAYGFLHGDRGPDGTEVVSASLAHWWVEVYFPGTGWVEFDPTGGGVGQPEPIPSGSVGIPTRGPSQPAATFREPTDRPGSVLPPPQSGGTGIGPFIAIALILAVGIAALAFAAYRRTPNKPMDPNVAWGSVARLAARFGLGPRPSQTVYEYAGALGDAVPEARIELTTIARAKVEVAYGHRDLGTDRLKRIAQAYQRLRFALLGVVLRRGFRRRNRR